VAPVTGEIVATAARYVAAATCGVLIAGLVLLGTAAPVRAETVPSQQQKIAAALAAAGKDLDASSAATAKAAAAYAAVQAKLVAAQRQLAAARGQLTGAQAIAASAAKDAGAAREALAGAQQQVLAAGTRVADKQTQIDAVVRDRYEAGPAEDVTMLIGSGDPNAYLERAGLLQSVIRGRDTELTELRAARTDLLASQAVVRDRAATVVAREQAADRAVSHVAQIVAQANTAAHQLAALAAQRSATLTAAAADLTADRQRVAQLQQESTNIAALIRQRELAAAGGVTSTVRVGSEGLIYPVAGPVTSEFGYRVDPVTGQYQLHAGIDLGVGTGTPIHAAKAGTVVFAGTETGYGNYTCVDHGGGFSTCYAHQSQIEVSVGEHVTQGQVIGLVGSTGYATGPHLHFETRVNGEPEDPRQFL
jgi:murein DD-endopeptidase MepM/ murein hydrolase activator NlpD